MSKNKKIICGVLTVILLVSWFLIGSKEKQDDSSGRIKLALRAVGDQLLLWQNDRTSLVLPVKKIHEGVYELTFQKEVAIQPEHLAEVVALYLEKNELPRSYRVQVFDCVNNEVAYSYEVRDETGIEVIPCLERTLPKDCYRIQVQLVTNDTLIPVGLIIGSFLLFGFIIVVDVFKKNAIICNSSIVRNTKDNVMVFGFSQFYPEEHKLILPTSEMRLSKKECELLVMFASQPNIIIKREILMKRVWEDHGVFVGRSLDTYISKLRKKLKADASLKLINVHGVGYKLVVTRSVER